MKPVNEMTAEECISEIERAKGMFMGTDLDAAHDSLPAGWRWGSATWYGTTPTVTCGVTRFEPLDVKSAYADSLRLAMLRASTAAHRAGKEKV